MKLLSKLVLSSRPISWVNTAFPFAVAYYLVTQEFDLVLIVGTLFFFIPYNLLMYGINDVFDYESDLRNPRKGGIEGALLDPKYHKPTLWIAFTLCAPFVAFLILVGNPLSNLILALVLFTVIAYSIKGLRFKEIPILDSLTSATHFVGPMWFGVALAQGQLTTELVQISAAFMLWGMASHGFGAVQDIRADREAGIGSVATFLGAKLTTRVAFAMYVIAGVIALSLPDRYAQTAIAAIPYLLVVGRELNITDQNCERANRGWKVFIFLNFLAGAIVSAVIIGPLAN